jgi:hypothetical protein
MRVAVEQVGRDPSPTLRAQVRGQLLLSLGRLCANVRSVTVRIEATSDLRGQVCCTVRVSLTAGTFAEARVFDTSVETALERAINRAARATARRAEEHKK